MRIFIPPGHSRDGSAYLAEILQAFGLSFTERCSLGEALKVADGKRDVILLPSGSESPGIESFLQAGGSVVAIRPGESLERLAGLHRKGEHDGPSRLRLVRPLCNGARGETLWTPGPITVYENKPDPGVSAYLFRPGDANSESLGIVESRLGSGRLVVYAYDPWLCVARLRQGNPERVGWLPPGENRPRSLYLHDPNPPPDTLWNPTADLHCIVWCEIVRHLLSHHAPAPTLWHIPNGKPAILLFSGDEDVGTQEANHRQMSDLESVGGSMSLYVIPDNTSITRERVEEYTRRGHAVSVHPNMVPLADQPIAEQLARAEQLVRLFRDTFQWPVLTVRNHNYGWPGYLEIPGLWERLGIGLDANTCAYLYRLSPEMGPFANVHAGLPLRFVREDGSLIDVFQQPTHINDDLWFHPTVPHSMKYSREQFDWIAQRIWDDSVRYFHTPICANFHPCNYVKYSGEYGRIMMTRAHELGLPIWSLDRWHNFWRARSTWRMTQHEWDGEQLRLRLAGQPCEGLTLTLPSNVEARPFRSLWIGDSPALFEMVQRQGRSVVQAIVPSGSTEVTATAEYSPLAVGQKVLGFTTSTFHPSREESPFAGMT